VPKCLQPFDLSTTLFASAVLAEYLVSILERTVDPNLEWQESADFNFVAHCFAFSLAGVDVKGGSLT